MDKRAKYVGSSNDPVFGEIGTAWPDPSDNGHDRFHRGVWCFEPDRLKGQGAFYVDPERDLEFVKTTPTR